MPASAQKTFDLDTWTLSRMAMGMTTTFKTDAEDVFVRYNFSAAGAETGDWLWPINGHSGADIYVASNATGGVFRWAMSSGNGCKKMRDVFAVNGTSCVRACGRACMRACVRARVRVCVCACVCMRVCVRAWNW